nr:hypothetical protein [uncultured organism]
MVQTSKISQTTHILKGVVGVWIRYRHTNLASDPMINPFSLHPFSHLSSLNKGQTFDGYSWMTTSPLMFADTSVCVHRCLRTSVLVTPNEVALDTFFIVLKKIQIDEVKP